MKILAIVLATLLLAGCEERYRYPCQDPANENKSECTRPVCEADGMCYDALNGLPPKQEEAPPVVEEAPAASDCNCNTGE